MIRQPETQPIFKKDKRRHLIENVMNMFGDWRLSRFEREASVRTGLRSELCLSGYDWKRSDDEAAVIVAEAFRLLGAARPSWQEGQWEYTISRDYCAWCHSPIDDEDRTDGQRFCSPHCARCSLEWRARSERGESKAIVQAARALINRRSRPPRPCASCGRSFQSAKISTIFCSSACANRARGSSIPDVACLACGKMFHPRQRGVVYCSKSCAMRGRLRKRVEKLPDRSCAFCDALFRPATLGQIYCSEPCARQVEYLAQRIQRSKGAMLITPPVFDYVFGRAANAALRPLTPIVFDTVIAPARHPIEALFDIAQA